MTKEWSFEVFSYMFIIVFCVLIVGPIYMRCGASFHYYFQNVLSIFLFLSATRYIFLLKFTPISRTKWVKMLFIFLPIPFVFFQVDSLYEFQRILDEQGTISFFKGSSDMSDYDFGKYIRFEFIFFCVSSIMSMAILPIRMIVSFWRTTNTTDRV